MEALKSNERYILDNFEFIYLKRDEQNDEWFEIYVKIDTAFQDISNNPFMKFHSFQNDFKLIYQKFDEIKLNEKYIKK
jgi:hypothetical protein